MKDDEKNGSKSFYIKLISGDDKLLMASNVVNDTLPFRDDKLETDTQLKHVNLIARFEISIPDQATNPCCSCEHLLRNKDLTSIRLSNNIGVAWDNLKSYITQNNSSNKQQICKHCKKSIKQNQMPARCVLNGLNNEPVPLELQGLDALSMQLIQLAKCFQTVVRLGTYTCKVPTYNSLTACKGTVFLPLPLHYHCI